MWFGEECRHVYVAVSLRCSHKPITTLLIGCNPIQSKKLKKKEKKM